MVETTVRLKPAEQWREQHHPRWYSSWAPGWLKRVLRPLWPEHKRMTWDELTSGDERRDAAARAGPTPGRMPIKTRIDMLTTGVRTPIGIKVFGTDLQEIERVGTRLEHLIAPIAGTRSVLYERNLGGLYVDIIPRPDALARYGLRVGDIQAVIESAIGGTPIGTTIEGRNRFSISVRYPQDLRNDIEKLRRVLVPLTRRRRRGAAMPMGTQGSLRPQARRHRHRAGPGDARHGHAGGRREPGAAPRPRLPGTRRSPTRRWTWPGACARRRCPSGGARADAARQRAPAFAGGGRSPTELHPARDSWPTSASPAARPWCATRPGCWSATCTSTSIRAMRDIGGYVDEAKAVVGAAMASGRAEAARRAIT